MKRVMVMMVGMLLVSCTGFVYADQCKDDLARDGQESAAQTSSRINALISVGKCEELLSMFERSSYYRDQVRRNCSSSNSNYLELMERYTALKKVESTFLNICNMQKQLEENDDMD